MINGALYAWFNCNVRALPNKNNFFGTDWVPNFQSSNVDQAFAARACPRHQTSQVPLSSHIRPKPWRKSATSNGTVVCEGGKLFCCNQRDLKSLKVVPESCKFFWGRRLIRRLTVLLGEMLSSVLNKRSTVYFDRWSTVYAE